MKFVYNNEKRKLEYIKGVKGGWGDNLMKRKRKSYYETSEK